MDIKDCHHFPDKPNKARTDHCEAGDNSRSLRVCLTCGHVGCCDSSPGRHARKHAQETGHQVMTSYPGSESSFIWCYEHDDYLNPDDQKNLKSL